jgi:hypothetical protein
VYLIAHLPLQSTEDPLFSDRRLDTLHLTEPAILLVAQAAFSIGKHNLAMSYLKYALKIHSVNPVKLFHAHAQLGAQLEHNSSCAD